MAEADWDCEAYGPEAREHGALCFFADRGARNCATAEECAASMAAERQLVFQRINELAARNPGDQTWAYLSETFTSPGQLLGGGDPPPPDQDDSDSLPAGERLVTWPLPAGHVAAASRLRACR